MPDSHADGISYVMCPVFVYQYMQCDVGPVRCYPYRDPCPIYNLQLKSLGLLCGAITYTTDAIHIS